MREKRKVAAKGVEQRKRWLEPRKGGCSRDRWGDKKRDTEKERKVIPRRRGVIFFERERESLGGREEILEKL